MALRKEKLESYRELLTSRRETLLTGLRTATQVAVADEVVYSDSIDQAAADTDKALAMMMKSREREQILQIDEALRRIELGSFGECERCSEPITEARMQAFPLTTLCIDCKAELESEEHRFPGRA